MTEPVEERLDAKARWAEPQGAVVQLEAEEALDALT